MCSLSSIRRNAGSKRWFSISLVWSFASVGRWCNLPSSWAILARDLSLLTFCSAGYLLCGEYIITFISPSTVKYPKCREWLCRSCSLHLKLLYVCWNFMCEPEYIVASTDFFPPALISVLKALRMSLYASDKCALICLFRNFVASQLHQKSPTDRMSGLLWCWIGPRTAEVAWDSSHRVKMNGFMNQLWLLNSLKQYEETRRCLCLHWWSWSCAARMPSYPGRMSNAAAAVETSSFSHFGFELEAKKWKSSQVNSGCCTSRISNSSYSHSYYKTTLLLTYFHHVSPTCSSLYPDKHDFPFLKKPLKCMKIDWKPGLERLERFILPWYLFRIFHFSHTCVSFFKAFIDVLLTACICRHRHHQRMKKTLSSTMFWESYMRHNMSVLNMSLMNAVQPQQRSGNTTTAPVSALM